ncbi:MAG: hypothetical protein AB1782_18085 [Cyanobacteriota bacterium]
MKKTFILAVLIVFITSIHSVNVDAKVIIDQDVKKLKQDIVSLNLINGLYLSKSQLEQYLCVLNKAKNSENQVQNQVQSFINNKLKYYKKLKSELINNTTLSDNTLKDSGESHRQEIRLKDYYEQSFYEYEQELKAILNENQLEIVNSFTPCLIPKNDFINPSRVGQANDSKKFEKILERVHKMPANQYYQFRNHSFNRYLDKYEKHFKDLSPQEEANVKARLYNVFEKARSLSDVDFELQKGSLAEIIKPPKHNLDKNRKKNQLSLLGKVMLNTNLIPVIEQRLRQAN